MDQELKKQLKSMEKDLEADLVSLRKAIKDVKSSVTSNEESVTINETGVQQGLEQAGKELADLEKKVNKAFGADSGFARRIAKFKNEFMSLKKDANKINNIVKEKHGIDLF